MRSGVQVGLGITRMFLTDDMNSGERLSHGFQREGTPPSTLRVKRPSPSDHALELAGVAAKATAGAGQQEGPTKKTLIVSLAS